MSKLGKKIVIVCLVIILCVLVYLLVPIINKIDVVVKYNKAYKEYFESDNRKYYYEHDNGYGEIEKGERYYKDDKSKSITTVTTSEEETTSVEYGTKNSTIYVYDDSKTFLINPYSSLDMGIWHTRTSPLMLIPEDLSFFGKCKYIWEAFSYTHTINEKKENIFSKLKSVFVNLADELPDELTSEEYDGKPCYKMTFVSKFITSEKYTTIGKYIVYIDKEQFLPVYVESAAYEKSDGIRKLREKEMSKYNFEKDVVKDEDVNLPDLSSYTQWLNNY